MNIIKRLLNVMLVLLAAMPMNSLAQAPTAAETAAETGSATPDKPVFALGNPFVDNAIFQQQMEVPIWGTAKPGTKVRVTLGEHTGTGVAKADGTWRVMLPAMKADALTSVNTAPKGRSMTVVATQGKATQTLEIKNTLIGEVWLCSGQSNMAGPLKMGPWPPGTIKNANYPALRQWRDDKWILCTPETSRVFSRVAFCFARKIQSEKKVPFALLMAATGGSPIEAWMREVPEALQSDKHKQGLKRSKRKTNYETKIMPVIGYAIRGALWYQGEANAKEGREYFQKMKSMISDWRASWGQGDFPFYFVQIASIGESAEDKPQMGDGRAKIRNAQLEALTLNNTGMAVTIDIGAVREHPVNKYDVGLRLARWARHHQYGEKALVPSGPIYKGHKVEGATIRVSFNYTGAGLMLANKKGYEPAKPTPGVKMPWLSIQDKDGTWHWAQGKFDGSDLIVWSDQVKAPVAVRYAYTQYPLGCNLYNKDGLPASPFSTSGY
jgi:sialate O-acetylesterase